MPPTFARRTFATPLPWSALIVGLWFVLTLAVAQRSLQWVEGDASCMNAVVLNAQGQPETLPAAVKRYLECGHASLSPNARHLTYVRDNQLLQWDFQTRQSHLLATLPPALDGLQVQWSPNSQHLALVLIEPSSTAHKALQVRIVPIAKPDQAKRYSLLIAYSCASTCFPLDVRWISPTQLRYQTRLEPARYQTLTLP